MDAAAKPLFNWEETRSETDDSQAVRAGSGRRADGPAGGAGPGRGALRRADRRTGAALLRRKRHADSEHRGRLYRNQTRHADGGQRPGLRGRGPCPPLGRGLQHEKRPRCRGHGLGGLERKRGRSGPVRALRGQLLDRGGLSPQEHRLQHPSVFAGHHQRQRLHPGDGGGRLHSLRQQLRYAAQLRKRLVQRLPPGQQRHLGIQERQQPEPAQAQRRRRAAPGLHGLHRLYRRGGEHRLCQRRSRRQLDPRRRHRRLRLDAPGPRRRHPEVRGGLSFRPPV